MTNDDIQLLYEYDRWANDRILHAAASLGVEEFTRDLGGSFRSVRDTLVHIVGSEWAWLTYWLEPSPTSDFLESLWTREEALFDPNMFPDITAVQTKWVEVERQQIHFANGITNNSLAQTLPVRGKKISLAHLMQHLVNHSTYHRGQIAGMLRQLKSEPLATDFAFFLLEGQGERAAAR